MTTLALNTDSIKSLPIPVSGKVDYFDTGPNAVKGFVLEVRSSGGRTFHLRWRDDHSRLRQHKISDAESLTVDAARKVAQKLSHWRNRVRRVMCRCHWRLWRCWRSCRALRVVRLWCPILKRSCRSPVSFAAGTRLGKRLRCPT